MAVKNLNNMELIRLQKSCHGKSAMATYAFTKHKMDVYLMNNVPCEAGWGETVISVYVKPNTVKGGEYADVQHFTSYADFRKYRSTISVTVNQLK